jgi:mRNA-degrading endonuclease RelE of RelBE toxin-antitoxin system
MTYKLEFLPSARKEWDRLVYEVIDERVVVAVGKRERSEVYERAKKR